MLWYNTIGNGASQWQPVKTENQYIPVCTQIKTEANIDDSFVSCFNTIQHIIYAYMYIR